MKPQSQTTIPILGNILCEAAGNKVTVTATDLELSIRTSCEAKVKKEGSGTIPAKKLLELVRLLPEGEIRFKLLENHWVQILADRKTYKMVGMAKDNFPAIPEFPHPLVTIPAKLLSSLIAKTAFAISNEESRYTLNGALLLLKPDTITMVATDGHRLAVAETDHKFDGLTREVRPLVPKKALTEVQRLAAEAGEDGQIEFALDDSHLFFRAGERLLISRMLTGQFPNYEAVLPRENNKHVVIERGELNDAGRPALPRRETFRRQGRHRNFRVQPGVWRSEGNPRKRLSRRAAVHRLQRAIHVGFSRRRRRRPNQPRTKR